MCLRGLWLEIAQALATKCQCPVQMLLDHRFRYPDLSGDLAIGETITKMKHNHRPRGGRKLVQRCFQTLGDLLGDGQVEWRMFSGEIAAELLPITRLVLAQPMLPEEIRCDPEQISLWIFNPIGIREANEAQIGFLRDVTRISLAV